MNLNDVYAYIRIGRNTRWAIVSKYIMRVNIKYVTVLPIDTIGGHFNELVIKNMNPQPGNLLLQ